MRPARTLEVLALLATTALVGCDCDDCDDDGESFPIFLETERNDDPLSADHFGVLRPGDHFFIDGTIRDDTLDPFDGFAFTAGDLIHVDFQLFINDAFSDLDVCLYDPQLDQTVDCFISEDNPERGGVDVVSAGFDFHLVVESFVGISSYSLEIVVQPLLAAQAARAAGEPEVRVAAVGARRLAGRASAAEHGYRREKEPSERLEIESTVQVDLDAGFVLETIRVNRRR